MALSVSIVKLDRAKPHAMQGMDVKVQVRQPGGRKIKIMEVTAL